ncbi:hypothetical protein [Gilvimarinus japonicus]|uniref:Uncharacterized protein n=1 Tax=Gilvimarinus japonicus TaxID=1796469 RepID=A0ABV7HN32_9GAMM
MAKPATTTQHTNDEVVLTPQQLAAYHSAGLTLQDQDGNFIGSFTAAGFSNDPDQNAMDARDEAQQSLAFLNALLGQNPGYLELEAPAVMGLSNILEDISNRLEGAHTTGG